MLTASLVTVRSEHMKQRNVTGLFVTIFGRSSFSIPFTQECSVCWKWSRDADCVQMRNWNWHHAHHNFSISRVFYSQNSRNRIFCSCLWWSEVSHLRSIYQINPFQNCVRDISRKGSGQIDCVYLLFHNIKMETFLLSRMGLKLYCLSSFRH